MLLLFVYVMMYKGYWYTGMEDMAKRRDSVISINDSTNKGRRHIFAGLFVRARTRVYIVYYIYIYILYQAKDYYSIFE